MVVKNITKEKFSDEDSQVSHLSHPDNDDDEDGNAKAQFAAATSVGGGDHSTVATGKSATSSSANAAAGYATLCGVKRSRVLIVLAILAVGGIVGGLAYHFTSRNEQQDFEAEVRYVVEVRSACVEEDVRWSLYCSRCPLSFSVCFIEHVCGA